MKKTNDYTIATHQNVFRERCSATDTKVIHLNTTSGKKVFKLSYNNGNAFEHFTVELFDGVKLNPIFNLTDLGLKRNTSAYHLFTEAEFRARVKELNDRAITQIKTLF